jgi:flagellar hook-length control protein FliK
MASTIPGPIDAGVTRLPGHPATPLLTPAELAAAAAATAAATTTGQRIGGDSATGKPGSTTAVDGPKATDPAGPVTATGAAPDQLSAAGQLSATPALIVPNDPGPTATAPPPAVSSQVAEQVSQFMAGARTLRDGTHRAVIKLSPEHLGDVTVTLDVRGGSVRMDLIAGPQAIGALQNDLNGLRDQLSASGLQLDDVSFQQSGPAGGDFGSPGNREPWRGNDAAPPTGNSGSGERLAAGVEPAGYRNRANPASGQLDVLI